MSCPYTRLTEESFFHPVQNIVLISLPDTDLFKNTDFIHEVVMHIAKNKDSYHVQAGELGFDAFVRMGDFLYQYSYDESGNRLSFLPRQLQENGLFHARYVLTEQFEEYRVQPKKN